MKNILLLLALSFGAATANAQLEIKDANNQVKGYFFDDGSVSDASKNTVCRFLQDGKIIDKHSNALGYIINDHEIQDAQHVTRAYINVEGRVENAKHEIIGKINSNGSGAVKDAQGKILGYIDSIEPMWAAAYFFVLKY